MSTHHGIIEAKAPGYAGNDIQPPYASEHTVAQC